MYEQREPDEQREAGWTERERDSIFQMVFLLLIKKRVVVHAQECVVVGDLLLDWTSPTTTIYRRNWHWYFKNNLKIQKLYNSTKIIILNLTGNLKKKKIIAYVTVYFLCWPSLA